jgi:flagellar operon protein
MQSRGVKFNPEDIQRLGDAVQKARAKGSKDSLVLMNDNAVIVSVKNNTVVTVVDKTSLKENVFTNIDSTIVI